MPEVEVSEHIEAPPHEVWGLIADPTSMADLVEECTTMRWASGSTRPGLGARFRGSNRSGWRRWTTTCTIVRYDPGHEVAWDVTYGPLPVARWSYRVESAEPGTGPDPSVEVDTVPRTVLFERFEDQRGGLIKAVGPFVRGTKDAEAVNRDHMVLTLRRIKSRAEA